MYVEYIFVQRLKKMHQHISTYLFQNKICPLPGFGTLSVQTNAAEADFVNHLIKAPVPVIFFDDRKLSPKGLLDFIAFKGQMTNEMASRALDDFCAGLKREISEKMEVSLEAVGNFYVDNNGNMVFEQQALPAVFYQPVSAERVVHPQAEHSMLVGDRETTNMQMTEYFNETEEVKDRWWIWAIVLGALALLMMILYFTETSSTASFGNTIKI